MPETPPVLALTTGDPAGIGPEISLRAAVDPSIRGLSRLMLIGAECVHRRIIERLNLPMALRVIAAKDLADAVRRDPPAAGTVELIDPGTLASAPPLSLPSEAGGRASADNIELSIQGALAGHFRGVVTAPINKLSLSLAHVPFPGHTEIFGERTRAPHFAMLMYSPRIAVGLVTCHQSLASVPGSLTTERIAEVARLTSAAVERIRGKRPRLAILGLNPHAGESGLFGDEELRLVAPAIRLLEAEGYDVTGPLPPDTAFTPAALGRFDAHICLYHDQGLIPFKALSFADGVNVTMGLPFVRTSVDHGTAYDLAGRGVAEISSMLEAIQLAARLA